MLDEQGDLARFPLAMLLSAISYERGTGMLDLTHDATHRRIYLIEGRPTFMQSNYEGENVGALLLRRGRVTEPDFERCLRYMKEEGRTLQQSLLDLKLVTEPDLATAYKLLAGQLLPSALGMARGRYRWRETDAFVGRVPEGNFDPMSLLFDGIKRFVHPPQIFSFFKGREDYPILPSELFERLLPYFRKAFSADNIAALIDGSATYRRISRDHANDAATVVPQLFALVTSGMAVVPEPDSSVDMMAAVEAAAQSAGQEQAWLSDSGGKLDVSSGRENMARAIDRYYDEIMASDFFQVIGVGRDSSTEEIKARYFELARKWNPDFYDDAELGPRRQVLGEVFGRITEAYDTLTDRVRREEYVLFLDRKAKGLPTDVAEISRAEQLFDQADAMMKRGDWPKACEVLAEAIKGSPEPTYFAALGWATFNLEPSRQANVTRAVQLLKRALSMQQNLPIAHQYLGRVCHARGQITEARKWWKRCLELEPHNAEAIRGLRAISKAGVSSGGDEPSKNGLLDRFLQKK
ncbi:MAG TPA: DnaJ domain-containing protein [Myxococcales bacterium LLY-WYZ-16_1]|nr:DnaJ domain-containing protein [Myxococcales bacterium LLY-WYZ-16_1]